MCPEYQLAEHILSKISLVCPRILITHTCNNNLSNMEKKLPLLRPKTLKKRKAIQAIPKLCALHVNAFKPHQQLQGSRHEKTRAKTCHKVFGSCPLKLYGEIFPLHFRF